MLYVLIQIKARASTSKEVDALVFSFQSTARKRKDGSKFEALAGAGDRVERGLTLAVITDPISGPAKMQVRIF